ncbi:MAG: hypothetical protein GY792_10960 [Gammaproteobacteria bacterium]|nr:hypothetical protein [Gammaproteobacteria bacterium]
MIGNRRIILIVLVIISIAIGFWTSSRYPALQGKADMTGVVSLIDPLVHDPIWIVEKTESFVKQVAATTVNWVWTNKKGMTFAVFIAAAFLALLGYLPKYKTRNRFLNSVYGMATGTPLGVCVNCVAPIAKAMYEGGRSIQTSIAVMFSSPTLNIIVLTMLFTLLPPYLAVIKLAFTFFLILGIVPFLTPRDYVTEPVVENVAHNFLNIQESWLAALKGVVADYVTSFKYIVIRTVPLMFLAGFLGALMSHLWDPDTLIGSDPSLLTMLGVAAFGTFLPLPIAVDVMVTQSLFAANVPMVVVMTLLFTLGSFSIYSFFIVWRSFSPSLAIKLFFIVSFLGLGSGYLAQAYYDFKTEAWEESYEKLVLKNEPVNTDKTGQSEQQLTFGIGQLQQTLTTPVTKIYHERGVLIDSRTLASRSPSDLFQFTRQPASTIGITAVNSVTGRNFIEPFILGRGLASGDFNNDGWIDIAVATDNGFELFQNLDGQGYSKVPMALGALEQKNAFNVAMIDMNNDGWLDFYLTTYADGNYLVLNPLGDAPVMNIIPIKGRKTLLTMSLSMGDINNDGWLDVFHGNWNGGELVAQPGEYGVNELLINRNLEFSELTLPKARNEIPGNSLSALLSDINQDSRMDLMVGNDFEVADQYYINLGGDGFQAMQPGSTVIPESPLLNMSIDTADYNNDLLLDVYMTGGAWIAAADGKVAASFRKSNYCERIEDKLEQKKCIQTWMLSRITLMPELKECDEMEEMFGMEAVKDCMVADRMHQFKNDRSACAKIPSSYPEYRTACDHYATAPPIKMLEYGEYIPQAFVKNILLTNQGDAPFVEESEIRKVNFGGWAWAGKFADVDNDEWQDIYVVNGSAYAAMVGPTTHLSNTFFHNRYGSLFKSEQVLFGLDDLEHSSAFVYIDYDNDGDLDILSNTIYGGLTLFKNNEQKNNSIQFNLVDYKGNRACVGCKIIIHYGDDGNYHQVREIKAGGAFLSFDAPTAHFGLGEFENISKVEVEWSTGEKSVTKKELLVNRHYTIRRQ